MLGLIKSSIVKCAIAVALMVVVPWTAFASVNKYEDSINYKAGLKALEGGNAKDAQSLFAKEIVVHPDNGYAFFYLSVIALVYNDWPSALHDINEAINYLPDEDNATQAKALMVRSRIRSGLNKVDEALEDLDKALNRCPGNLDILRERAELYHSIGDFDRSDADYNEMLYLQPGNVVAELGLGKNNIGRGEFRMAIDQFDRVAKIAGYNSDVYAFRAEACLGLNHDADAVEDLLQALEIDNNAHAFELMAYPPHTSRLRWLLYKGLKKKQALDGNNSRWAFYAGIVAEINGEYISAIDSYKEALNLEPKAIYAKHLSDCFRQLRDWDNALSYLDQAIQSDENNIDYLAEKAEVYWYADRLSEAVSMETRCIEELPNFYYHYYRRGCYKEMNGDYDGALEDYSDCLSRYPDYAPAYLRRGRLYKKQGYEQMAQKDFAKCVSLDDVPEENSCAEFALFYLGRRSEATDFMQAVLKRTPAYYDAACLYSLMNKRTAALEYLEKAFENGYNNFNYVFRDPDLVNIRGEKEFKALIDKYVDQRSVAPAAAPSAPKYKMETEVIPYTTAYNIIKVKGKINGYSMSFTYIQGEKLTISALRAEYFLKYGYIRRSDIKGTVKANGRIPVGSKIKFSSLQVGEITLTDVEAEVVDDYQQPLTFGDALFDEKSEVGLDANRQVITVTTKILL